MFIGRVQEKEELKQALAKKDELAKVIVLTGRRRVGKSTLIEHYGQNHSSLPFYKLVGMPPQKTNRTTTELNNLATQIQHTFDVPKPRLADWDDALWAIAKYVEQGNCILMIDEINWFGKTYDNISNGLFTLWESKLKHIKGFTLILTGSLASWIQKHITESQGWYGRLSWEKNLQPIPLVDSLDIIPVDIRKRLSVSEQLRYLMVSGGIPRYLEVFNFSQSLEDNLLREAYSESGYLFREFDTLMKDLFRTKGDRAKSILNILSEGKQTAVSIAKKLKLDKPNGHLYADLDMMEKSAFIRSVRPWNLTTGTFEDKDAQYYISDPYLRFYYKGILPHIQAVKLGNAKLPDNLDSLLGFQFEYVMRENLSLVYQALSINSEDVLKASPYQTKGLQIDLLIETRRYFYIVEMKFQLKPLNMDVVRSMKTKVERFECPDNKSVRTAIIHVNGAQEKVENSDYIDISRNLSNLLS
ncbi:AAA family ATPase [Vibrio penaeicida]|uniref:AAA family ATPase n=1 Tax=Vibrio penaeicida TaxID=104609 RepID=UPI000CEA5CC5|nr:AAA family ATPase [Vibrio penaeicida]